MLSALIAIMRVEALHTKQEISCLPSRGALVTSVCLIPILESAQRYEHVGARPLTTNFPFFLGSVSICRTLNRCVVVTIDLIVIKGNGSYEV